MGVIIYSFNLHISPKMLYGVLEHNIVMLQNFMLMILNKRFWNKKGVLFVPDPVFIYGLVYMYVFRERCPK